MSGVNSYRRFGELRYLTDPLAYNNLPEPIKMIYSQKEWMWMTDTQKAAAVDRNCEPDYLGE